MRRPHCLAPLLLAAAVSTQKPASVPTPGMTWEQDLATAHAVAEKDHRPVVAYFTFET